MPYTFQIKFFLFCFVVVSIFGTGLANGQKTRVSIGGTIEQVIIEENPVRYEYVLVADGGNRYQLSASQSLVGYVNRRVSLSGVLDRKRLNVDDKIKVVEENKTSSSPAPTYGKRKVLTLLVNFTNNQTQEISVEQARERVFTGATSANQYFKEASFYRYELTGIKRPDGDVVGWLTLPFTDAPPCDVQGRWTDGADALARQNGYEPDNYNSVLYVFPHLCGNRTITQMGMVGDTTRLWRTWFNLSEFREYQIVHELGHNLGLNHANAFVCSGAEIPNNCQSIEFGDPFDEMGIYSTTASFFFNNYFRLCLGWLTGRAQTVTASGDYTLVAANFPAKGNQVLRIQAKPPVFPYAGFSYTLELRRPYSFDNRYFGFSGNPAFSGVSIRYTQDDLVGSQTNLIDTTPLTSTFVDAPLTVGNTFTDTRNGITITTLSVNPMRGARVRIQLNR